MCFHHDFYWCPDVAQKITYRADTVWHCIECRCRIGPGEWYHSVRQQEHEECRRCEDGECECPGRPADDDAMGWHACECEEPDHGERFEGEFCARCCKVLTAVEAHELAEGCRGNSTQPAYGELDDALHEEPHYADVAAAMFPDLALSGHLGRLTSENVHLRDVLPWPYLWGTGDLDPVDEVGGEG